MGTKPSLNLCRTTNFVCQAMICSYFSLGSLSKDVFERRTSTGSGLFSFLNGGFAQVFSQITSLTVKKQRNSNFISSKHVKRENALLPVDVRRSKTPLLKLSIFACSFPNIRSITHLSHRF